VSAEIDEQLIARSQPVLSWHDGCREDNCREITGTQLGYRFVDTDAVIEEVTKQSITQIFARFGEPVSTTESQVLAQVCAYTNLAIATGGGIVMRRENWSYLHHGLVVWLDVPVELLCPLDRDDTRPLLNDPDPLKAANAPRAAANTLRAS